jgi:hypothetical protein
MLSNFVDSSMITSIGYDPDNAILEIEFKSNGSRWQYYDVPQYVYDEMMCADSVGKYFHANIKGKYRESRV